MQSPAGDRIFVYKVTFGEHIVTFGEHFKNNKMLPLGDFLRKENCIWTNIYITILEKNVYNRLPQKVTMWLKREDMNDIQSHFPDGLRCWIEYLDTQAKLERKNGQEVGPKSCDQPLLLGLKREEKKMGDFFPFPSILQTKSPPKGN